MHKPGAGSRIQNLKSRKARDRKDAQCSEERAGGMLCPAEQYVLFY